MQSTLMPQGQDVIGRTFVVGCPNSKGEFILILGEQRYVIPAARAKAGERVRIIGVDGEILMVEAAVTS